MTQKTFEKTILRLKEQLYRFAFSILKDQEEAQDAVQEVVLRLWKKKDELDETRNLTSFCMSMIHNYCLDIIRKQKQLKNYTQSNSASEMENPNHEQADLIAKIKSELKNLPLQQRIVIELKDFQGYDYEEIIEMLDLSVNAIRVNVSRGRKRLYQLFKEELEHV